MITETRDYSAIISFNIQSDDISAIFDKVREAEIPGTGLSYVSTSGGGKSRTSGKRKRSSSSTRTQQQKYVQQQKQLEYSKNCEMVDEYNEFVDLIRSIHCESTDLIDWSALRDKEEPFSKIQMGPNETEARKLYDNAKTSFLGKIIPSVDKRKMKAMEESIEIAKQKDQQIYEEWEETHELAQGVLNGDINSYFYVVSEMEPFSEILEYGSDFDIGTELPDIMEVEFHAKTSKVVDTIETFECNMDFKKTQGLKPVQRVAF